MSMDAKTRMILNKKLEFSAANIQQLEDNPAILSRTLNLLDIMRKIPGQRERKVLAKTRINQIRQNLNAPKQTRIRLLQKARAEHYSFQRIIR